MKSFAILIVMKMTGKGRDDRQRRERDVLLMSVDLSLYPSVGWKETDPAQSDL
jgi:hypothetical protein